MRETRAQDAVLTDYANSLIRFKARQLSRRRGFSRSDQKDLEQDLWESLISQSESFDPERASIDTFIDRVVNSAIAMILRKRRRQKRANGFHAQSLDAANPKDQESRPSRDSISEADHCRRNGTLPHDERERRTNQDAIEHALDAMPPDVSDVCRRVMGGSISSAARELGISRRQVRNALAEARTHLKRAGFGDQ